jgi:agmatine deiminase
MAFPAAAYVLGDDPERAEAAWAAVANTVARHEPVTMVVDPARAGRARALLDAGVATVEIPLDDSWARDAGPTFVLGPEGELGGVAWTFNGWGAQDWAAWGHDAALGRQILAAAGARAFGSALVNEGGGIGVDGAGTALATETVQLDPARNPGWTAAQVEAELRAALGVDRVVWLPRGLWADYGEFGTRGHADLVAAFARPALAAVHHQPDPSHPDHEVTGEARGRLRAAGVAVAALEAPPGPAGDLVDWSYVNFYVGNGFVLLGTFGHTGADDAAADVLALLFPGRRVERVDARPLFAAGGGVHCITQQEPQGRGGPS